MSITRREQVYVLLYALILAAITTLPYLLASANQGDEWRFGGFLIGAEDGNSYLGKMRLGARGLWDFYLFYTAEEHQSASLIFLPYILPGQIVRLFINDTNPALTGALMVVFHAMRVVFDIVLVLVMYRFIGMFLRSPGARMLALALATLGGGLGWLLALIGQSNLLGSIPADFYIPEGFTFIVLFTLPHLALARAALLGGFLALLGVQERGLGRAVLAGVCWCVVGLAVPFYLTIIYCLVGAWLVAVWLRERAFPSALFIRCAIAGGITLPLFAYYTLVFSTNPAFAQWSAQNLLPSPHPLHYALAYGVLGALAFVGARYAWRDVRYLLLVGWVVIVPFLVYIPIPVQRRMAEAVFVPLAILATMGIRLLAGRWARRGYTRSWKRIRAVTLVALLPTSLILLFGGFLGAFNHARPLFIPTAEVMALDWLNTHAEPDSVVLSSKMVGNLIPAWTSLRVYVGHGPETLDAIHKEALVERFFRDELTADKRRALFEAMRIRYVFYGTAERELAGNRVDSPAWQAGLTLVYDEDDYQIYEVAS